MCSNTRGQLRLKTRFHTWSLSDEGPQPQLTKLHGAEAFLRSYHVSQSRNSPHFTEPNGSIPHSQEPVTLSLSWGTSIQSMPSHPASLRSILILSLHLCLGLSRDLLLSGFPTKLLCASLISPCVLHALQRATNIFVENCQWKTWTWPLNLYSSSTVDRDSVHVAIMVWVEKLLKLCSRVSRRLPLAATALEPRPSAQTGTKQREFVRGWVLQYRYTSNYY